MFEIPESKITFKELDGWELIQVRAPHGVTTAYLKRMAANHLSRTHHLAVGPRDLVTVGSRINEVSFQKVIFEHREIL